MTSHEILSYLVQTIKIIFKVTNYCKCHTIFIGICYYTDIDEYCPSLGYLRTLASSRPSISQLGTIFTDICALKYTYSILPLSNCPLSPGNGHLSKLHINKAHFYLRVQKENAQCLSKYITFWLRCILSRRKSS